MGGYNKRGYLNSDFKIFHLTDQISTEFEFHYHEFHKITIFISGNGVSPPLSPRPFRNRHNFPPKNA